MSRVGRTAKKPKGETPVEVQHGGAKRYIAGGGGEPGDDQAERTTTVKK